MWITGRAAQNGEWSSPKQQRGQAFSTRPFLQINRVIKLNGRKLYLANRLALELLLGTLRMRISAKVAIVDIGAFLHRPISGTRFPAAATCL